LQCVQLRHLHRAQCCSISFGVVLHHSLHCSLTLSPLADDEQPTCGGAGEGGGGGGGGGGRGGSGGGDWHVAQSAHLHQPEHMDGLHEEAQPVEAVSPGRCGVHVLPMAAASRPRTSPTATACVRMDAGCRRATLGQVMKRPLALVAGHFAKNPDVLAR